MEMGCPSVWSMETFNWKGKIGEDSGHRNKCLDLSTWVSEDFQESYDMINKI